MFLQISRNTHSSTPAYKSRKGHPLLVADMFTGIKSLLSNLINRPSRSVTLCTEILLSSRGLAPVDRPRVLYGLRSDGNAEVDSESIRPGRDKRP